MRHAVDLMDECGLVLALLAGIVVLRRAGAGLRCHFIGLGLIGKASECHGIISL